MVEGRAAAGVTKTRRIAVLGFRGVGKSSLVTQFVDGHFSEGYYPTIEQTQTKALTMHGQTYNAEIIDTAGQDEYSILNSKHAVGIHGYILVYSITSRTSLEMCAVIRDKILNFTGTNFVPMVIVGNKGDLEGQRQVTPDMAEELATRWHCATIETSAKQNQNVIRVFELMLEQIETHSSDMGQSLQRPPTSGSSKDAHDATGSSSGSKRGAEKHGFAVEQTARIEPLALEAALLRHKGTGAKHLHVAKDDANNVFCVTFTTPPADDSGVAHILEHTVLCGSRQFPVRDPFFKMLNRSLSSFMNAMTGSDFTMYPFATPSTADFDNLFRVYMDAVFDPLLRELDFAQEGWRVEHAPGSKDALVYKGVVFNEMKGALSDVDSLFRTRLQQAMYEGSPYGYVSGGDPPHIPELSYDGLRQFHSRHYTPSNARFFSYGSQPLDAHLERLAARLAPFGPSEKFGEIHAVPSWAGPRSVEAAAPVDPLLPAERQVRACVAFLANPSEDVFDLFAAQMATGLLVNGAASPMYKALIESHLGTEYSPGTGYSGTAPRAMAAFGLQGIRREDVGKMERLVEETLKTSAEKPFERARIDATLHEMELMLRHRSSSFGMNLLYAVTEPWTHGLNPLDVLRMPEHVGRVRSAVEGGDAGFLNRQIAAHFLGNSNRLLFVMAPDAELGTRQAAVEEAQLGRLAQELSPEKHAAVDTRAAELRQLQETPENVDVLPMLSVSGIPRSGRCYPLQHLSNEVQGRATSTNGLVYMQALLPLDAVGSFADVDLLKLAPLWTSAVGAVGTRSKTLAELEQAVRQSTGGIQFAPQVRYSLSDPQRFGPQLLVSSHCRAADQPVMYALIRELLTDVTFQDLERLEILLRSISADLVSACVDEGHAFALSAASAGVAGRGRPATELVERWSGLTYLRWLTQLSASVAPDVPAAQRRDTLEKLAERLRAFSQALVDRVSNSGVRALVHADEALLGSAASSAQSLLDVFSAGESTAAGIGNGSTVAFNQLRLVETPFSAGFASLAIPAPAYASARESMECTLLARLLSSHFLHGRIREQGGAYGAGVRYQPLSGVWGFYSYRDPSPLQSVDVFRASFSWLADAVRSGEVGQRHLDESKLGTLKQLDAPLSAWEEGQPEFRLGVTESLRQERRAALLDATLGQLVSRGASLLSAMDQGASTAVLAPASLTAAARAAAVSSGYSTESLRV